MRPSGRLGRRSRPRSAAPRVLPDLAHDHEVWVVGWAGIPYMCTVRTASGRPRWRSCTRPRVGRGRSSSCGPGTTGAGRRVEGGRVVPDHPASASLLRQGIPGVTAWRNPDTELSDGQIFTQRWPTGPKDARRDQTHYCQSQVDRARRTREGIDEQVAKAEAGDDRPVCQFRSFAGGQPVATRLRPLRLAS